MSQSLVPVRIPGAQGQYPGQQLYPKTPGSPTVQTHAAQTVFAGSDHRRRLHMEIFMHVCFSLAALGGFVK